MNLSRLSAEQLVPAQLSVHQTLKQIQVCEQDKSPSLQDLAELPVIDSYHPLVEKSVMGLSVSTLAGRGSALQISRFLDNPFRYIYNNPVGGLQGLVSAASGAVASHMAPDQTSGTVVGALTGAVVGGVQGLLVKPTVGGVASTAITGAILGGAAGHVTHALRQKPELHTLPGAIAPDELGLRPHLNE
ncbi:MAG: hypothetical protein IGS03_09655 [Candidatus Sericytochromatia bacterium]|nr:hypothetical protein [Candidatus Sericytochromatia bacterium]